MDKLAAMVTFVEIVDRGSLSAAAETLGKSLPTVVRTLATLEQSLGVRLLHRTTRRMSLTEEGHTYLGRCRQILADVRESEQVLISGQSQPTGGLRVTAPALFGQMYVTPLVADFLAAYERVHVDLLLLDRVVNMVEEGIDVGIRIARLADASMISIPVGEVRRVVVASPALIARVGAPAHSKDFSKKPCVHFQGTAAGGSWTLYESGAPVTVATNGRFVCNQATAALDACLAGLGFGLFLSYQVAPWALAKKLQVLDAFSSPPIPVSIVYPHARLMSTRTRTFVDFAKAALQESLGPTC